MEGYFYRSLRASVLIRKIRSWRWGRVIIWVGLCQRGKTELITVAGNLTTVQYCDDMVEPVVLPFLLQHAWLLQQGNACPYTVRYTQNVLRRNNIAVLWCTSRPPHLSPIEHMWNHLGRKFSERNVVITVRDLMQALHEKWVRTPLHVRKLIDSMRRRCAAVLAVSEWHINTFLWVFP
jgi:hypothetical protein